MLSLFLYGALTLLLILVFVWAWHHSRTIGATSKQREDEALARIQSGKELFDHSEVLDTQGSESMFAGIPSQGVPAGQIDVADVSEAVDIERLLAGESYAVVSRARARLEEPTNLATEGDSLPPRPALNHPLGDSWAARAAASAQSQKAVEQLAADQQARQKQSEQIELQRREAARMDAERKAAEQRFEERRLAAKRAEEALVAERQARQARQRVLEAEERQAPSVGAVPHSPERALPLRELTLAWFEARGYRSAPASEALRPIELVLRHMSDPARVYGFVVEDAHVTEERVQALHAQAKSVGLMRVLIVANGGADPHAYEMLRKKGVRLMDRAAVEEEFAGLDFSVAAKIIAVARKRAALNKTPG